MNTNTGRTPRSFISPMAAPISMNIATTTTPTSGSPCATACCTSCSAIPKVKARPMPLDPASHPAETAALPFAGTTANFSTADDWRRLFASYSAIVLVANSDSVDIDSLRASMPEDALFVFFNKVYKVLDRPFNGNALLAVRSGRGGPHIVSRGQVDDVVGYFPSD